MPRWVLHVDMDAFFASVEQVLNPALRGKPVIVAGPVEERGVVSAASYEARRYGVRSAMPTAQAKRLCPDGVFIAPSHHAYSDYSARVLAILQRYTPLVEPTSVDEAYLDVTGCEKLYGDPVSLARRIKDAVRREVGLTCSVGVAPNRLLAKMASGLEKPDGLTVIRTGDVPAKLWPKPVGHLHGIGPSTRTRLRALGVATIGDLARYPVDLLIREFGTGGRHLHEAANGLDDTPVRPVGRYEEAKSVSHETTFARDIEDRAEMERTLLELSDQVARRLRRYGYRGRTVTVKVRKADFTTVTRSTTLSWATDLAEEIYAAARQVLDAYWKPSVKVRLLGVGVSHLEAGERGAALFDAPSDKLRRASKAVDGIKARFGEGSVTRARLLGRGRRGRRAPGGGAGAETRRGGTPAKGPPAAGSDEA